ncbi:MAG: aspartate-semialdehyde dehydrogenase [Thiothrix sp.]
MQTVAVAVVGATTFVGEAILDLLAARKFPVGKVYALEAETDGTQDVDFGNKTLDVEPLADFDFTEVQLVFFASDAATSVRYVPRAVTAGCIVIDDSEQFRMEADVPLVVAEVNPQAIAGYTKRRIIANPGSNVTQLLAALQPLHQAATLTRLEIATYQAVSDSGRAGVQELAQQTAQLLNGLPVDAAVYPRQIAFNLLPRIGTLLTNGYSSEEMKLVEETRKVLDLPTLAVNPTTVRVPVFFGHAAVVHLETATKLSALQAIALLQQNAGLTVMDDAAADAFPTPVTDAVNSEQLYISRIRESLGTSNGLNLWLVADNIRRGAALNAVKIAEILINAYPPAWFSEN